MIVHSRCLCGMGDGDDIIGHLSFLTRSIGMETVTIHTGKHDQSCLNHQY